MSAEARFWSKVRTHFDDACWSWRGSLTRDGYCRFWDGKSMVQAHRFSWRLHNGDVPDGMFVCHRCGDPECCNPDHLFLGTAAGNNADRNSKGRTAVGIPPVHTVVFQDELPGIQFAVWMAGLSVKELSEAFGLKGNSLSQRGIKSWRETK